MNYSRRNFLKLGLGAGIAGALGLHGHLPAGSTQQTGLIVGALRGKRKGGPHFAGVIATPGWTIQTIPTGFEGHGFAVNPTNPMRIIMFPHHPEPQACEIDLKTQSVVRHLRSAPDRHFYGHGTFSPDGKWLFATENDYTGDHGVITIRDGSTLELVGEFPSYGVDPHEMLFLRDGETVAIANGGLKTDPRVDGGKTIIGPVESSLVFVEVRSQKLLTKLILPNSLLSFRHLAPLANGDVAVSMQDKGFGNGPGSLLYRTVERMNLRDYDFSNGLRAEAQHHSLSVAKIDKRKILLTSPNGNLITLWDAHSREMLARQAIGRASGVAQAPSGEVLISRNSGEVSILDPHELKIRAEIAAPLEGLRWGAHLTRVF